MLLATKDGTTCFGDYLKGSLHSKHPPGENSVDSFSAFPPHSLPIEKKPHSKTLLILLNKNGVYKFYQKMFIYDSMVKHKDQSHKLSGIHKAVEKKGERV